LLGRSLAVPVVLELTMSLAPLEWSGTTVDRRNGNQVFPSSRLCVREAAVKPCDYSHTCEDKHQRDCHHEYGIKGSLRLLVLVSFFL